MIRNRFAILLEEKRARDERRWPMDPEGDWDRCRHGACLVPRHGQTDEGADDHQGV